MHVTPHGNGTLESMLTLESAQLEIKSHFYCFSCLSLLLKVSISTSVRWGDNVYLAEFYKK